jgi:acetyltransferase-like isoleucine patch superfamily enzyme
VTTFTPTSSAFLPLQLLDKVFITLTRHHSLVILDCGIVKIGSRVQFGPFVSIFAATHETSVQSRRDGVEYAISVSIGDDCWIGGNTTIMPGVKIGKGCTIGASSVVTKDIPDFSVAIGSPARVVKKVDPVPDL